MKDSTKGLLLVAISALFWGITGNVGSFLSTEKMMTPAQFIVIRLFLSGFLLTIHRFKGDTLSMAP